MTQSFHPQPPPSRKTVDQVLFQTYRPPTLHCIRTNHKSPMNSSLRKDVSLLSSIICSAKRLKFLLNLALSGSRLLRFGALSRRLVQGHESQPKVGCIPWKLRCTVAQQSRKQPNAKPEATGPKRSSSSTFCTGRTAAPPFTLCEQFRSDNSTTRASTT